MHHELAENRPLLLSDLKNVLVLGAGNFGTCLAFHLSNISHSVTIYARDSKVVDAINSQHVNPKYMKDVRLPDGLKATNERTKETFEKHHVLLFAIPTEHLRQTLTSLKNDIRPDHLLIFANKGLEIASLSPPFVIVRDVLGAAIAERVVFLSGPSFAAEVVDKQPTMVVAASQDQKRAELAQMVFHTPQFRVYTSLDPIGVEVAGALKNVIAIASGIATGVGFQMNCRAALLTRGLAEMTRVGVAMGANPLTFMGLSGIGDLFLTCTSEKSRNFTVGFRLGKGEKLEDILATLGSTAEGVPTTKSAFLLARKLNVDTPIIDQMHGILYESRPIKEAVSSLLRRIATSEHDSLTPFPSSSPSVPHNA